jgi:alanine dehydrogenase
MTMLVLSQAEVARLLDVDLLLARLERAFVELSAGRASVPPRIAAFAPDGLLGAMPGYVDGVLAAKLVTLFPGHEPSHQALIAVFDAETGTPSAVLDGTHITAVRTGASSAVATRALAREDARVLTILGAGVQGRAHLDAVGRVRDFDEVRVTSRTFEHAQVLAQETGAVAVESIEQAVRGSDVVCCCTHSSEPVLSRDWLSPGAHVTSVGAALDGPELDPETIRAGLLCVESRVAFQPPPAGSFELQGLDPDEAVELGEVLASTRDGRTSDEQITVYKSMGHAVEDAAAAALVLERASSAGS